MYLVSVRFGWRFRFDKRKIWQLDIIPLNGKTNFETYLLYDPQTTFIFPLPGNFFPLRKKIQVFQRIARSVMKRAMFLTASLKGRV